MPLFWGSRQTHRIWGSGDAAALDAWTRGAHLCWSSPVPVIHVKSLIREADDRRWAIASRICHVLAWMELISP